MEENQLSKWDLKFRMKNLLFQESLSDVTFIVGDPAHRYPCHKLILATGSKVFEAMLYGKLAEKQEISVPDVTSSGFSIMLRYLYTDEVRIESQSDALDAGYASKKYIIKELFQACEDYLLLDAVLNLETAFSLYEEASFLEMKKLQNRSLSYISRNARQIFRTDSFFKASVSTLEDVLKMNMMHVDSEEIIIEAIWRWGKAHCEEQRMSCNGENIRSLTTDLLKYVRFLSLDSKELEKVFEKFQFLDESEQLAILWNIAMPSTNGCVRMPSNLCEVSRNRCVSNSSRLDLPTKYRYDGDMTNFSVKQFEQRMNITTTGSSLTIVGVVIAFKPVSCYSSQHRQLKVEVIAQNETTKFQTSVASSKKAPDRKEDDQQLEDEILLDDYVWFGEGDVGHLTVRVEGEGVRIMECMKDEFSRDVTGSSVTFSFKQDNNDKLLFPIKEIMYMQG